MKISVITLELNRTGKEGLICKDNLRADITVAFYLRVNETAEDVLRVAKSVGVGRASDREAVNQLFNAKFSEALKTVGKKLEFMQLFEERQHFRDSIVETIGEDLNGYVLEDVAIDYLEQTPKSSLDSNNILDSEGIKRITEITAMHNVETNRLERDQELEIQRKNVSAREASLELERSQSDAEARQQREIETLQARESSETEQVRQQERARAEAARIKTDEELAIADENKQRQIEMAMKARERAVQIEEVRIRQARELEDVNRERAVEIERIGMEKALEEERKEIADITSQRIAVERNVAEEEENIKDVRNRSEAERLKVTKVVAAEAEAEELKLMDVKAAEAAFERAKFEAEQVRVKSQADLDAAEKNRLRMRNWLAAVRRWQLRTVLLKHRLRKHRLLPSVPTAWRMLRSSLLLPRRMKKPVWPKSGCLNSGSKPKPWVKRNWVLPRRMPAKRWCWPRQKAKNAWATPGQTPAKPWPRRKLPAW